MLRESEPDWIIYYHHAALVMVYTEHDDAAFEAGGLEGCRSWGDCVSRAAARAYQADLADELESSWTDAWEEHGDAVSVEDEEEEGAVENP